jgi:hypothetical protein
MNGGLLCIDGGAFAGRAAWRRRGVFDPCPLSGRERLAIEDHFFRKDIKIALSPDTTGVVIPQSGDRQRHDGGFCGSGRVRVGDFDCVGISTDHDCGYTQRFFL